MKKCKKCLIFKVAEDFPKDSSRHDGLHPYCRKCRTEEQKQRNKLNTEKRLRKTDWTCLRCEITKKAIDFFNSEIKPRGAKALCLECKEKSKEHAKNSRKYEQKHYLYQKEVNYPKAQKRRNELKTALILEKGGKCTDCHLEVDKDLPAVCFDFHHTDPSQKDINISKLLLNKRNREILLKELTKTIVLCANCHRKRHFYKGVEDESLSRKNDVRRNDTLA